jgi:hypothetical protein
MILRCASPRPGERSRACGRLIGTVPDGAEVVGIVATFRDVRKGFYGLRCVGCGRKYEIRPPLDAAA